MNVVSMRENIDPSYYRLLAGQQQGSLIGTFEARHPSIAERLAAGKALREKVPRTSHATYEMPADRPDPSPSWRSRTSRASRSWCRCVMPACWPRPSPSCAARRR